jgi:hypothetical protein
LEEAIHVGIKNGDFFGYADGIDETGRFQGLCLGDKGYPNITPEGLLVKLDIAKNQIEKDADKQKSIQNRQSGNDGSLFPDDDINQANDKTGSLEEKKHNTRFYAGITVDHQKLGTTAGQIKTEILQHFVELSGVSISVSLDIQVTIPNGTPPDIVRIVNENCDALNIKGAEFRDE